MTDEDVRTTFEGIVMHSILDCATPKPPQDVASKFYTHREGGIARDIYVSREGYARFFEIVEPDQIEDYWLHAEMHDHWTTCFGRVTGSEYRITIISHDHSRVSELLDIAPYLWKGSDDRSD